MSAKSIKKKLYMCKEECTVSDTNSPMSAALVEAHKALARNEVPIGAVIIDIHGKIIARAHNLTEQKHTQAAHAEVLAIAKAGKKNGGWRLEGCWLYVTLEPCAMCYNLAVLSRVAGIVYGAASPLFGYTKYLPETKKIASKRDGSSMTLGQGTEGGLSENPLVYNSDRLPTIIKGIEAEAAAMLLKTFFKRQRKRQSRHGAQGSGVGILRASRRIKRDDDATRSERDQKDQRKTRRT